MLLVLVDYDNVESALLRAGPVALARILVGSLSGPLLAPYDSVHVRLYGGWRSSNNLTTVAQRLVPSIRADSPTNVVADDGGGRKNIRLTVELAERPVGTSRNFEETLARERTLRSFRARSRPWSGCANTAVCGLSQLSSASSRSKCPDTTCGIAWLDVLVRDEQKMVDTLIVADMAHQVFVVRARDIVVVSSDTDMWPGVLLAVRAGCHVTQIHTKHGWRTQRHLLNTLDGASGRFYSQITV
jgi:uncharacterized LabA/DUF88 family protein